jgi:hypothetical protein
MVKQNKKPFSRKIVLKPLLNSISFDSPDCLDYEYVHRYDGFLKDFWRKSLISKIEHDSPIMTSSLHGLTLGAPVASAPVHAPILNAHASAAFYDLKTKRALLHELACKVVSKLTELECDIHLGLLRRIRRPARS